ncbi:MAG: bacteriohemerythrin [Lachnospira sp.]
MLIEFDDSLITGNNTIDEQHKELIKKISDLVTTCENGDGKVKAIKMLDYLTEYTNFHFSAEEELQKKAGYPDYDNHHAKHEEFKSTIKELFDYLDELEGPNEDFVEKVKTQVVDWLFRHIKSADRSVAEYLNLHNNADII